MQISNQFNNEKGSRRLIADIKFDDSDVAVAAAAATLTIRSAVAGEMVKNVFWKLVESFDGGATSELTVAIGHDLGSGTDDPDGFIAAKSIHEDATEIPYAKADGALMATAGGFLFTESGDIEIVLTATGGNLDVLTQGHLRVFLEYENIDEMVQEYAPLS